MNTSDPRLANEVRVGRDVLDRIRAAVPDDDPDFAALVDAECDALERVRRMLSAAREAEAFAKALADLIAEQQARKTRYAVKADNLRQAALWALGELGLSKWKWPEFSVSVSPGKPRIIGLESADPAHLPAECCRIKREPDRAKIRAFLEGGLTIEGISLGNAEPVLRISAK